MDEFIDRDWGELEGEPVEAWEGIRATDSEDLVSDKGVESQVDFFKRMVNGVNACEERIQGAQVLLISHCDALQVIDSILMREVKEHYSEHPEYKNAQIKDFPLLSLIHI